MSFLRKSLNQLILALPNSPFRGLWVMVKVPSGVQEVEIINAFLLGGSMVNNLQVAEKCPNQRPALEVSQESSKRSFTSPPSQILSRGRETSFSVSHPRSYRGLFVPTFSLRGFYGTQAEQKQRLILDLSRLSIVLDPPSFFLPSYKLY